MRTSCPAAPKRTQQTGTDEIVDVAISPCVGVVSAARIAHTGS